MAYNTPPLVRVDWPSVHRLIPSHFPPIDLFETVADPQDLAIVFALEALTNDRLKAAVGDLRALSPQDCISGPGASPVMAAFTHLGQSSRFTDGRYGIYYGANSSQTAIAETVYHRTLFLSATREPDCEITMREYINQVALPLHDITNVHYQDLHHPNSYLEAQNFAFQLKTQDSNGLLYHSVRRAGGLCIAGFRPKSITIPIQGQHLRYVWSGARQQIISVLCVTEFAVQ